MQPSGGKGTSNKQGMVSDLVTAVSSAMCDCSKVAVVRAEGIEEGEEEREKRGVMTVGRAGGWLGL